MTDVFGSAIPLAAAPMAGGPTTARLAAAASAAGAFAFLAGGYKTADVFAAEIRELRATTTEFGVNLFAPGSPRVDPDAYRRYLADLAPEAERLGVELPAAPVEDDDGWRDKVDLLVADPVPVVSFTFGLPTAAESAALRRAGTRVLATVTTVDEARAAADLGMDGLVAQGSAAGGHSGTYDPSRPITAMPTSDLTRAVVTATGLPVVAAGGVHDSASVAALLTAGADAVAVGTVLLRADESGASATHKDALADPQFVDTVITHAFTGRPARGLRNRFVDRYEAIAPLGYPALHHLTRPLRQAAAAAGDPHTLHLWAGTGFRAATVEPVATILDRLASAL